MMDRSTNKDRFFVLLYAFFLYFITGAACVLIGTIMPQLMELLQGTSIERLSILGSAYAFGRLATVYLSGRLAERLPLKQIYAAGLLFCLVFLAALSMSQSYSILLIAAIFGGISMGTQDCLCPLLLSKVFGKAYASSLSAGQAVFACGTMVAPFLIGLSLNLNLDWRLCFYLLMLLIVVVLLSLPFTELKQLKTQDLSGDKEDLIQDAKVLSLKMEETQEELEELEALEAQETPEKQNHKAQEQAQKTNKLPALAARNKLMVYLGIAGCIATLSCVSSCIMLYTTSFGQDRGLDLAQATFLFTLYNIGCLLGDLCFTALLRRFQAHKLLPLCYLPAAAVLGLCLLLDSKLGYFISLFYLGLSLGALFSLLLGIATRLHTSRISVSSSLIAMTSGCADLLTPVLCGLLVGALGLSFSYKFIFIALIVGGVFAFILKQSCYEEGTGSCAS